MKILKPISVAFIAALTLAGCGTTKTVTTTTSTAVKAVKESSIITATDSISPKTGKMTEAQIQAWPHMDVFTDSVPGMSLDKAYAFVKDKKGTTVIVGVIDSGIDIEHEDLKDVVWVNSNEIAGNNKDDDNNGYIDDVHGWNFLGGEKGKSVPEQLELTRIVKKWMPRFDSKNEADIAEADKADFKLFTELKSTIDKKLKTAKNTVEQYTSYKQAITMVNDTLSKILAGKEINLENINAAKFDDPALQQGKMILMQIVSSGSNADEASKGLDGAIKHFKNQLDSQYNINFKGRLTKDNPNDITDTNYGNHLVIGSIDDEMHGTHVSGIIAATRNNNIGMNGVAHNVKIMAIRAVPDGDEYDKDVALAIRYAVDNGAKVINMSFGKGHSPNAEWVFDAIKYAAEKDVLLVHAAGNSNENIDTAENFPNDSKDKLVEFADNVLTVGAMTRHFDDKLVASFSNFGKKNVDVFAPGLEIYSTVPKNEYVSIQGTSMAAPEVAGVAALVRSYYPKLTASQVKHIIMDSGIEFNNQVIKPGSKGEKVSFDTLSVSGRILNAYNALLLAEKMSKK
ncbi:MAG TPA: peptidase S8 [Flavobacteriaceae bacterium]|jgi:subtilisin family serine protease|nr:peptidase S8 [Flavobacteriaceae bacterium]HBS12942.1 peptidase S8 [Flavobacteriaceae bacterium]